MTDINPRAVIGGNNPPDPMDQINAAFEDWRIEAENWTDGAPVQTEAQMKAVDRLREKMREWRIGLEKGQKEATAPLRAIYQAELDRWKPTIEDAKRIEGCLVAAVDGFKRKLAAAKAEAERLARAEAERAAQALRDAHAAANAADLEAQRALAQAEREAEDARIRAAVAKKDAAVKGMKPVTMHQVEDHRAALHWIARHDREAITAFVDDYARRNHATAVIDGVRVWKERAAR